MGIIERTGDKRRMGDEEEDGKCRKDKEDREKKDVSGMRMMGGWERRE